VLEYKEINNDETNEASRFPTYVWRRVLGIY